ncbi:hypothetical protein BD310DRAFT_816208 [Dichomitus squalens]|uniref:Uncharacterized protein n=1 Tax=Dichomitus squalens TaxID=114155 RepID=A0A4Q9PZ35_9APHY|nr:hypothetical protein BD310DRAFT_816208 [Dichomitus squalens]
MMRSPFSLFVAVLALFAGHVLALNITIGGRNITAPQFLNTSDIVLQDSALNTCGANDTCACAASTVSLVLGCQQCMFNQLIARNKQPVDLLAGQASALTAYSTACTNITAVNASQVTLTLPPDWDGPFGQGLTTGTTVVAVIAAFVLGLCSITIVNTM